MKYLLDTHTLLWVLFEDEKLSKKAQEVIRSPENEIYVSLITYWELAFKYGIGKLELENITPEEIPHKAKEINIDTLKISERDVSTYFKLPKIKHNDPFDRLKIWQAINKDITLISRDKEIKEYKAFGLKLLWD